MSLEWMGRVWAMDFESSPRKLVALVIADCHNAETGQCNPGPAYIAKRTNLNIGNVRKHLAMLAEQGLLRRPYPGGNWVLVDAQNCASDVHPDAQNCASDAQNCASTRAKLRVETRKTARTIGKESEVESEVEPNYAHSDSLALAAVVPKQRARDVLMDTVFEVCGLEYADVPKSAMSGYAKCVHELRAIDATPADVAERSAVYRRLYSGAVLTPRALVSQWAKLRPGTEDARSAGMGRGALGQSKSAVDAVRARVAGAR